MNSKSKSKCCISSCLLEKEFYKQRTYNENEMFPILEKILGHWINYDNDHHVYINDLIKASKGGIFKIIFKDLNLYGKGIAIYDGTKQFDIYIFGNDFMTLCKYYGQGNLHLFTYKKNLLIDNQIYVRLTPIFDFPFNETYNFMASEATTYDHILKNVLQNLSKTLITNEPTTETFSLASVNEPTTETHQNQAIFDYTDSEEVHSDFFRNHSIFTLFVNLTSSAIFQSVTGQNEKIHFQGANSNVTYCSLNVPTITTFNKHIPYQKYPNDQYWHAIQIDTNGDWVNRVTFFSFTPYIGNYKGTDYLANVNTSISSVLLKANNPQIFTTKRAVVTIIYTFNKWFAEKFDDPKNNFYCIFLPADMIQDATFTIIARFETQGVTRLTKKIRAFTFDAYPYPICNLPERIINARLVNSNYLSNHLSNHPVIGSNFDQNKNNINTFLSKAKNFNNDETYKNIKIYPYFYLRNNNSVVTNAYDLIASNSAVNALINDVDKNYYQTGIIKLSAEVMMKYSKMIILAINHKLSGYANSCNIQVYNVRTQRSLKTFETSSTLPVLSGGLVDLSGNLINEEKGIYLLEIDLNTLVDDKDTEIAIFERVNYPDAILKRQNYMNFGPRYTTFTYNSNSVENSSETDDEYIVKEKNIYNIQSNNKDFSLHLNYNPYSTLNFRVYLK